MLDQFDERGSCKRTQRSRLKRQHVFEAKVICSLDKGQQRIISRFDKGEKGTNLAL